MHKHFRKSIFFRLNYETQPNYFIYGLNSIPDFFLNYWFKKYRLNIWVYLRNENGSFSVSFFLHEFGLNASAHNHENLKPPSFKKNKSCATPIQAPEIWLGFPATHGYRRVIKRHFPGNTKNNPKLTPSPVSLNHVKNALPCLLNSFCNDICQNSCFCGAVALSKWSKSLPATWCQVNVIFRLP